jgi:hypothetical protein
MKVSKNKYKFIKMHSALINLNRNNMTYQMIHISLNKKCLSLDNAPKTL